MLIALLFNNFGPYHLARLQSANAASQEDGWQVVGIELARVQDQYPWQTSSSQREEISIVSAITGQTLEDVPQRRLLRQLWRVLHTVNPTVIAVAGYYNPPTLLTLLWCRLTGRRIILFSDTKEDDAIRAGWRESIKGWLVQRYHAALVGGRPHRRYLANLGMPAEAIFTGYDVVGNDHFHPARIRSLPRPLERPYFLAINRFVAKKNLPFLLNAYAAYRQQAEPDGWDLVLCGDGELRPQLEQQVNTLGLQAAVHLPGFLQQEQMLPYFAHAGSFIHASLTEQWGLVVNEAMAAGLPVLVSNRCGCFEDLVINGVTGFGFDPEDQTQLTNLMLAVSSGQVNLAAMGQAGLAHIQNFSPERFAQGLMDAVNYALTH
jgi:glycosyltransferase involved in cell wall biosynthesis